MGWASISSLISSKYRSSASSASRRSSACCVKRSFSVSGRKRSPARGVLGARFFPLGRFSVPRGGCRREALICRHFLRSACHPNLVLRVVMARFLPEVVDVLEEAQVIFPIQLFDRAPVSLGDAVAQRSEQFFSRSFVLHCKSSSLSAFGGFSCELNLSFFYIFVNKNTSPR